MSTILHKACRYMVETNVIEELEGLVERDGFEAWLVAMETGKTNHDLRVAYHAKRELLQLIKNLGHSE